MRRKKNKYTAWVLLSIFALYCFASGNGSVICIGDDGHSQIERSKDSCCDPSGILFGEELLDTDVHEDSECGDCDDIELSNIVSTRFTKRQVTNYKHLPDSPVCYICVKNLRSNLFSSGNNRPLLSFPKVSHLSVTSTVFIC